MGRKDQFIIGAEKFDRFVKKTSDNSYNNELMESIGFEITGSVKRRIAAGKFKSISKLTQMNRVGEKGKPLNGDGVPGLRASITYRVINNKTVAVGSPLKYASLMHFGGTIRPKKAKKLAIPIGRKVASLTRASGVRGAIDSLKSEYDHIFFTPYGIYGMKNGLDTVVKLFARSMKVEIPRRSYLYVDHIDKKIIADKIETWYKKAS